MGAILITDGDPDDALTPAELLAELRRMITGQWPAFLARLAKLWRRATELGLDLSELREWAKPARIQQMADGRLLPELAAAVGVDKPGVWDCFLRVSKDDQRRIAEAGALDIAERVGDGYTTRRVPLAALTVADCRLAIGPDGLRTRDQQAKETAAAAAKRAATAKSAATIRVDRAADRVIVGNRSHALDLFRDAFRRAGEAADHDGPGAVEVKFTVTEAEAAVLRQVMAGRGSRTLGGAARSLLRGFGLI